MLEKEFKHWMGGETDSRRGLSMNSESTILFLLCIFHFFHILVHSLFLPIQQTFTGLSNMVATGYLNLAKLK